MPMVINNSGDYPYWEYKPSPEEQAAYDQQFFGGLDPNAWHEGPNTGPQNFMERLVAYGAPAALGAMAGYGALGATGLLGAAGGGGGGAAAGTASDLALSGAIPELGWGAAGGSSIPLGAAGGAVPGLGALAPAAAGGWTGAGLASSLPWGDLATVGGASPVSGGGMAPGATTVPSSTSGGGIKWPTTPEEWFKLATGTAGAAGGAGGGQKSSTGSLLGGLLGAGLGYLDARNQPDNITVTRTMDPKLAPYAYSAAGSANDLLNQQLTGPNPLTQAGQQISGMSALPGWGSLVDTSKSQWDANPWIKDQQNAITDQVTRNFKENVAPAIGGAAVQAGGYGGSRQGIAEGLAASRLNQDLAPTLATLASDAWNSSQNRALAGAQAGANYGLNNQNQYVNNQVTGATLQANGPWNPYNNFSNLLSKFNGNAGAEITPLFTNVGSNMLGGALTGSNIVGSVDWNKLLNGIGGILGWFGNGTKQG